MFLTNVNSLGATFSATQENDRTLISALKFKLRTGSQGRVAGRSLEEGQASWARRERRPERTKNAGALSSRVRRVLVQENPARSGTLPRQCGAGRGPQIWSPGSTGLKSQLGHTHWQDGGGRVIYVPAEPQRLRL